MTQLHRRIDFTEGPLDPDELNAMNDDIARIGRRKTRIAGTQGRYSPSSSTDLQLFYFWYDPESWSVDDETVHPLMTLRATYFHVTNPGITWIASIVQIPFTSQSGGTVTRGQISDVALPALALSDASAHGQIYEQTKSMFGKQADRYALRLQRTVGAAPATSDWGFAFNVYGSVGPP